MFVIFDKRVKVFHCWADEVSFGEIEDGISGLQWERTCDFGEKNDDLSPAVGCCGKWSSNWVLRLNRQGLKSPYCSN
jgi:hypothetical protein